VLSANISYVSPGIVSHGSAVARTMGAPLQTSAEFDLPGDLNIPRTGHPGAVATSANLGTGGSGTF
jgi:hypothetical protein